MNRSSLLAGATSVALMLGMVVTITPATSVASERADPFDTITVVAPRVTVERKTGGVSTVVTAEKDSRVSIADLDLARTADLQVLEDRVRLAATALCEDLNEMYPFGQPSTTACIRRAIADTRSQVKEATALAIASY